MDTSDRIYTLWNFLLVFNVNFRVHGLDSDADDDWQIMKQFSGFVSSVSSPCCSFHNIFFQTSFTFSIVQEQSTVTSPEFMFESLVGLGF